MEEFMKKLEYKVSFVTPAFLGNAEQQAQWRTPPFKALLRQWWRVAYAADQEFRVDIAKMRREEGLLFGNAWLSHKEGPSEVTDYRKSLLRIRLNRWNKGQLKSWDRLEQGTVKHPEVQRTGYRVGPHAYLGYGPLDGRRGTMLADQGRAVKPGESATLSIAVPTTNGNTEIKRLLEDNIPRIEYALCLMDRYGTLGGRSRNGWGSFTMQAESEESEKTFVKFRPPLRNWRDCLALDWPHAVGKDGRGALVWWTEAFSDWKKVMCELAIIKIGLRTQFIFGSGRNADKPEDRHWLSYPVTRHNVRNWRQLRIPNSLRFKVCPDTYDPKKLRGLIFHVPFLPPPAFDPDRKAIISVWEKVYKLLDEMTKPAAERRYAMIADDSRRDDLRDQLDKVILTRIEE